MMRAVGHGEVASHCISISQRTAWARSSLADGINGYHQPHNALDLAEKMESMITLSTAAQERGREKPWRGNLMKKLLFEKYQWTVTNAKDFEMGN